jgi:hypothetical protein
MGFIAVAQAVQHLDGIFDAGLFDKDRRKAPFERASFSMYFWYSSSVVAPTHCSSPRARAGLSIFDASIAPCAAPAPTTVCSSSMKRIISPSERWTSSIAALSRSSNSPRKRCRRSSHSGRATERAYPPGSLVHRWRRSSAPALRRWRSCPTRFADQHRVVFGAARKDLHDALDLGITPDDWVEFPFPCIGSGRANIFPACGSGFRPAGQVTRCPPRSC